MPKSEAELTNEPPAAMSKHTKRACELCRKVVSERTDGSGLVAHKCPHSVQCVRPEWSRMQAGTCEFCAAERVRSIANESVHQKPVGGAMHDHVATEMDPVNWIIAAVEKRNTWLGKKSGRRIEESLDRVRLFERQSDTPVVEVWVERGNIERAKLEALTIALERENRYGAVA